MKRITAVLSLVLAIGLFAGLNHAATQQLIVSHFLTGHSRSATTVTLHYTLHIANPGKTSFLNLSLELVPLPPLVSPGTSVKVGHLGPGEVKDVSLQVVTPALLDAEQFSRNSLFWTGNYEDVEGKSIEFPVKSRPESGA